MDNAFKASTFLCTLLSLSCIDWVDRENTQALVPLAEEAQKSPLVSWVEVNGSTIYVAFLLYPVEPTWEGRELVQSLALASNRALMAIHGADAGPDARATVYAIDVHKVHKPWRPYGEKMQGTKEISRSTAQDGRITHQTRKF